MVQLCTFTPTLSATMHSVTDGRTEKRTDTDRRHYHANYSLSYCVTVQSAKKESGL